MATYYIDPVSGSDSHNATQAQSQDTPWASWSKAVASGSWTAGNQFLQKRGTTYSGQIESAGGGSLGKNIYLGAYGSGERPIVQALTLFDRALRIYGAHDYITVEGIEFVGGQKTGQRNYGGTIGSDSSTRSDGCKVIDCVFRDTLAYASGDGNGLQAFADDFLFERNYVHDIPTDGLWMMGLRPIIRFNRFVRCATDGRGAGDCVQIDGDASGMQVYRNVFDHSNTEEKQCFILSSASAGSGGFVAFNLCYMPINTTDSTSCILIDQPGVRVFGNRCYGGYNGIYVEGAGSRVFGNLIDGAYIGISTPASLSAVNIWHNTAVNCGNFGIYCDDDDAGVVVQANMLQGNAKGLGLRENATREGNAYWLNTTDTVAVGEYEWSESGAVTDDPLLTSSYAPRQGSPLIEAATYAVWVRDINGRKLKRTPDIGAHQYYAPREAVAVARISV